MKYRFQEVICEVSKKNEFCLKQCPASLHLMSPEDEKQFCEQCEQFYDDLKKRKPHKDDSAISQELFKKTS